MLERPTAVVRKEIISSTAPSIYGISRMDKVISPKGETLVFLGVCDGIAHLEKESSTGKSTFLEVDSSDFSRYRKLDR